MGEGILTDAGLVNESNTDDSFNPILCLTSCIEWVFDHGVAQHFIENDRPGDISSRQLSDAISSGPRDLRNLY